MHVVRQSQFKASPWKNGGGFTHEAFRVPERDDVFRWRVSVAHIDAAGPFSNFAGYARTMVLLRGAGVVLKLSDGSIQTLRSAGDMARFDGALGVECELVSGPCVDLNLMVSNSLGGVNARIERVRDTLTAELLKDQSMVVFSLDAPLELETQEDSAFLEPWDLAVINGTASRSVDIVGPGASAKVFIATFCADPSVLVGRQK
jgi:uncharacterized protein